MNKKLDVVWKLNESDKFSKLVTLHIENDLSSETDVNELVDIKKKKKNEKSIWLINVIWM